MVDVRDITKLLHVDLRYPIFQRASESVGFLVIVIIKFINNWVRNGTTEFGTEVFVGENIFILPVACELFWTALLKPLGVPIE